MRQANAAVDTGKTNLGYTKIMAPMAGEVVSITLLEGQTLNANQSAPNLLRIADISTVTVWSQVSEADIVDVKPGQVAYFTVLGSPRRWSGKVRQVLPTHIENRLRFRRGDLADGWLLATGSKPIPPQYGPGRPAPLEVAFLDQFSEQHTVRREIAVERSAKTLKSAVRPRPGLFDPVHSTAPPERDKGEARSRRLDPVPARTSRICKRAENEPERHA
jgi:hypothetical protein